MTTTAAEIVSRFRMGAEPLDILPLLHDKTLQNFAAVWSRFPCCVREDADISAAPEDENARWEWLWANAVFDVDDLCQRLGVTLRATVEGLIVQAKATRIIFPDGTISDHANNFLRGKILEALPKVDKNKSR